MSSLYKTVKEILKLCPATLLVTLYKIPSFDSVDDFIQKVATVRGKLKKGGILDVEATARIILHDWNEGVYTYMELIKAQYKRNWNMFSFKVMMKSNYLFLY